MTDQPIGQWVEENIPNPGDTAAVPGTDYDATNIGVVPVDWFRRAPGGGTLFVEDQDPTE